MMSSLDFRKCDLGLLLADRSVQEFLDVVHAHPDWSTEQLLLHIPRDMHGKTSLSEKEVRMILFRLHFSTTFRRQFILPRLREWEMADSEGMMKGFGEKISAEYLLYIRYRRLYKEGVRLPRQTQNEHAAPFAEVKSKLAEPVVPLPTQMPIQVPVRKVEAVSAKRRKSVLSLPKKLPVSFKLQAVKVKFASTAASTVAKAMVDKKAMPDKKGYGNPNGAFVKESYGKPKDNVEVVRGKRVEEIITPVLSLAKQLRVQVGVRTIAVKEEEKSLHIPKIDISKQVQLLSKVKQVRIQFKAQAVAEKSAIVNSSVERLVIKKKMNKVGRVKGNVHFFSKVAHLRVNFGVKTVEIK